MNHNPNHPTPYDSQDEPDLISSGSDARSWRPPRPVRFLRLRVVLAAALPPIRPGDWLHLLAASLFFALALRPWAHLPTAPLPAITDTSPAGTGGGGGGFGPYAQLHNGPGGRLEVAGLDLAGPDLDASVTTAVTGLSYGTVIAALVLLAASVCWLILGEHTAERAPFAWHAGNVAFTLPAFVLTGVGVWQASSHGVPQWPAFACLAAALSAVLVAVGQNREEVTWRAARRANRDLVDRLATLIGATPTDRSGQW